MNGASRTPATGQALRVLTFKASPRQIGIVGGGFFDFVARMECPFFRPATSCGMGARMQRRWRPAAAQLPHGVLKLAISSKVLSSVCTVPLPLLHSIPTVLLYFPRYPRICLGSKLLVIPMTKRDMDIFLIRHRMSVPRPPTLLLVRSSQVLQASSTRVRRSSPYLSIPMPIIFTGSSFSPSFCSSGRLKIGA